jgi:tRNA (guanine-N7-)-methyltransferase
MQTPRRIRSFVLRAGRTTPAQERALGELWPTYGIDLTAAPLDLAAVFGREARRCLEIGFGAGDVIADLAETNPHNDYLGIEVHRSGVGRLLLRAEQCALKNLRVICNDAVDVLRDHIADASFDEVLVFFPDPWHKKRHHKRLATDWQAYAEQMLAVCNANPALESLSGDSTYVPRPEFRSPTRFERRGERLGHGVWDLAYAKRVREIPQ